MAALRDVLLEQDVELPLGCPGCGDPLTVHAVVDLQVSAELRSIAGGNDGQPAVAVDYSPRVVGVQVEHRCGLLRREADAVAARPTPWPPLVCMCEHNDRMHQTPGRCLVDSCDCSGFIERNT